MYAVGLLIQQTSTLQCPKRKPNVYSTTKIQFFFKVPVHIIYVAGLGAAGQMWPSTFCTAGCFVRFLPQQTYSRRREDGAWWLRKTSSVAWKTNAINGWKLPRKVTDIWKLRENATQQRSGNIVKWQEAVVGGCETRHVHIRVEKENRSSWPTTPLNHEEKYQHDTKCHHTCDFSFVW